MLVMAFLWPCKSAACGRTVRLLMLVSSPASLLNSPLQSFLNSEVLFAHVWAARCCVVTQTVCKAASGLHKCCSSNCGRAALRSIWQSTTFDILHLAAVTKHQR